MNRAPILFRPAANGCAWQVVEMGRVDHPWSAVLIRLTDGSESRPYLGMTLSCPCLAATLRRPNHRGREI